jgi:prepilin-type N-terminal cleavage/methylation domain-containing protein
MWKRVKSCEGGFTLIEVMVVLVIAALLMAIGIVSFSAMSERAEDAATRSMLANAAKAEGAAEAQSIDPGYVDGAALGLIEPAYDTSGATEEAIHVSVGDVVDGSGTLILADGQVLLYARSKSGTWFGIRLVAAGDTAGRHSCSGAEESDVSPLATCAGSDW